ncbi:hypothetical protein [Flavobacterium sp. N2270]|uniref:hypothetical protein n=1 Tax=Flavobacterium sp. N2270 TaxID=2986831 RepID=UPI00222415C1|nr:hypothetical protein [Flavobacterium sp. N2270]
MAKAKAYFRILLRQFAQSARVSENSKVCVIFVLAWSWFVATSFSCNTLAVIIRNPANREYLINRKHMRFLTIILIITLVSCNKNVQKNGRLEIISAFCKYDNQVHPSSVKLKLFKKGKSISEIKLNDKNKVPGTANFTVSNLEYGDYYIEYKTIYNQKNVVEFEINQSDLKSVELCMDYLDYKSNKNILLLDELQNGEALNVVVNEMACFGGWKDTMIISRKRNQLIVEYGEMKHTLTPSQIKLLREFEIELRCNHKPGCSNIDTYWIHNQQTHEECVVTEESCEWYGFKNLIKLLKLKK